MHIYAQISINTINIKYIEHCNIDSCIKYIQLCNLLLLHLALYCT